MRPSTKAINEKEEIENDELMNHLLTKDLLNEINIISPINENNLQRKDITTEKLIQTTEDISKEKIEKDLSIDDNENENNQTEKKSSIQIFLFIIKINKMKKKNLT